MRVVAMMTLVACGPRNLPPDERLFDTMDLVLTASEGSDVVRATYADPPGTEPPAAEEIIIDGGTSWDLRVELRNERRTPTFDVTAQIEELGFEYQLFFTGTAVQGPATGDNPIAILTHEYTDEDVTGLPLGLDNHLGIRAPGRGTIVVRVQNFPRDNGSITKEAGFAELAAEEGMEAIPGVLIQEIEFRVTVE